MTIREAIWQYAEAKDLGCIMLDAAGHATVTRKPRGGLGVWATFSGAKKVARFINRKPVASFADVEAAALVCRVRLIPHAEIARHAEVATRAAKIALTKTVGALKAAQAECALLVEALPPQDSPEVNTSHKAPPRIPASRSREPRKG